ncbi:MAG: methylmalonyl Co-A mutase-associated GTPase MeaB [Acidimicrobiia bacterium]|nr:methylmalonyl Co-A mutase-associated GTPase MeaB [Acidimicrobiia bacterium]
MTVGDLYDRAVDGERRALGRLLSLVEAGGPDAEAVAELTHAHHDAHVVGITGAPGSGKSTLTGRLVAQLSEAGRRPAVLAVDPSSPLTGGAILGDRIRMDDVVGNGVFIRSMATRGHSGGLAVAVPGALRLFAAAGFDPVIVETVGVGQVEVDVAGTADTTVVVVTPGAGDAVQANKAGLLEVADLFVVNKADRPGAADIRRDLELMLDLSHLSGLDEAIGRRPPIVMATALDGTGADDVAEQIDLHLEWLRATDRLEERRAGRLRQEVRVRLQQLVDDDLDALLAGSIAAPLLAEVATGALSPASAARALRAQLQSR